MSREKRVRNLEKQVLQKPQWGTSKIVLEEEAEIALWEESNRISRNLQLNGDMTPHEKFVMEQLGEVAWLRAIDIFIQLVGEPVCGYDESKRVFFMVDLLQFINAEKEKFKHG